MKKNKELVVNLEAAKLTQKQVDSLHAAIHDTLSNMIKKKSITTTKKGTANNKLLGAVITAGQTANIEVEFSDVDAGLSDFTATHNLDQKTIHESDTISFSNVKVNDIIIIKGSSAGSKTVKITGVNALPKEMNFAAGQHINGIFLIVS